MTEMQRKDRKTDKRESEKERANNKIETQKEREGWREKGKVSKKR